jgi:hypothetical protein
VIAGCLSRIACPTAFKIRAIEGRDSRQARRFVERRSRGVAFRDQDEALRIEIAEEQKTTLLAPAFQEALLAVFGDELERMKIAIDVAQGRDQASSTTFEAVRADALRHEVGVFFGSRRRGLPNARRGLRRRFMTPSCFADARRARAFNARDLLNPLLSGRGAAPLRPPGFRTKAVPKVFDVAGRDAIEMQNVSAVLRERLAAFDRTPVQSSIRFEQRWQFKATPRGGHAKLTLSIRGVKAATQLQAQTSAARARSARFHQLSLAGKARSIDKLGPLCDAFLAGLQRTLVQGFARSRPCLSNVGASRRRVRGSTGMEARLHGGLS